MKWIHQYDATSGRTFEIPELDFSSYETLEQALQENALEIHAAVTSALYHAAEFGLDQVPTFAITGSDSVVNICRPDYLEKLRLALEYFAQHEEYELCQVLQSLEEKL